VCPEVCWNHERGLCEDCAPNLAEQAPAIQAQVAVEQAWEKARAGDQMRGFDMKSEASVGPSCGKCQATLAAGARFCPQCGTAAAPAATAAGPKFCAQCGGQLPAGARFCAGCGAAVK
jgi:predicted amidophosphoribosyltransferase